MKWSKLLFIILTQSFLAIIISLYFSNFGDPYANFVSGNFFGWTGFEPCNLCRWDRIFMYPLFITSAIWLITKDKNVWKYIIIPSILWVVLSWYMYGMQKFSFWWPSFCDLNNPCVIPQVWYWGFVTIPFLALIAFLVILISVLWFIKKNK